VALRRDVRHREVEQLLEAAQGELRARARTRGRRVRGNSSVEIARGDLGNLGLYLGSRADGGVVGARHSGGWFLLFFCC
jgi:hypothetical protein